MSSSLFGHLTSVLRFCFAETWTTTKSEGFVFSKRKSFAEYMAQYAREDSGGRDTIEN